MPKTSEKQIGGKITALIRGKPKSGKTILEASFPGPIYIFDFDQRVAPITLYYPDRDDIEYDTYHYKNFDSFLEKLNAIQRFCPYKTVIVDSLTSLGDTLIDYSILHRLDGNADRAKFEKKRGIIQLAETEEYLVEDRTLHLLFQVAKIIPAHFLMSAHIIETEQRDLTGKITRVDRRVVTAGKKVAAKIPGYFDEYWHVEKDPAINALSDDKYIVHFRQNGQDNASTSLPLPDSVDFSKKRFYPDVLLPLLLEKGVRIDVEPDKEPRKEEEISDIEVR